MTNVVLTAAKLVSAGLTGSVSLLSEGAHSATDVVASTLAFLSVRAAAVPPDEEHNYGHGKIESLAGFGESILLFAIVIYVVFESVPRLRSPHPIGHDIVGLATMSVSAVATLSVGLYVLGVGRRTESLALISNGRHLTVDFWSSAGVLTALVLHHFAHWWQADPIMALLLAVWIARNAWLMTREAFQQLIDRRISDEDLSVIRRALDDEKRILSYHKLRTRHSGSWHFIDLHVVVPGEWSVVKAHEVADHLEKRIESALSPAQVVIHVDPYDPSKIA